jgi:uncharacterized ferritin-like protein (DUF455 family)
MEIREWAWRILASGSLEEKLRPVREPLIDHAPGEALLFLQPARPANLRFAPRRAAPAMPALTALRDPAKRAVAHHIMANHELQALEVMARTLLQFPGAPAEFRAGMTWVMADEQKHTRMHVERARALGLVFGDLPVNCYIWKKSLAFCDVLDYLAGLPLLFEGRNLDHTLEFAEAFSRAGDERSSALMRTVHRDEIEHVRFGIDWLRRLKPAGWTDWQTFTAHLQFPLKPEKAVGDVFQREARLAAGLTEDFVRELDAIRRE